MKRYAAKTLGILALALVAFIGVSFASIGHKSGVESAHSLIPQAQSEPTPTPFIPAKSIALSVHTLGLTVGQFANLAASLTPLDATDARIMWLVSGTAQVDLYRPGSMSPVAKNELCAQYTVDIMARTAGRAVLTAVSADGRRMASAQIEVSSPVERLRGLEVEGGQISPQFSPVKTKYNITLDEYQSRVRIVPEISGGAKAVLCDGEPIEEVAVDMDYGQGRTVTLSVVAQDDTQFDYTFDIARDKSSDARVMDIVLTGVREFSFSPRQTEYRCEVEKAGQQVTMLVMRENTTSNVAIDSKEVRSLAFSLEPGETREVNVSIKAQNGTPGNSYKIVFHANPKVADTGKVVYLSPSMQINNKSVCPAYGSESYRMNLIADILEEILERHGVTVCRNTGIAEGDIDALAAHSLSKKPDLHVALHSNASLSHTVYGVETWTYKAGNRGDALAHLLQKYVTGVYTGPGTNRGVRYYGDGLIIKELKLMYEGNVPSALVEIGFHDTLEDAQWVIGNMDSIGAAVARAILEQLGLEYNG